MISAVVLAGRDEHALALTLAALAPAAVDGLVREVIVSDAGENAHIAEIVEEAGGSRVTGSVDQAIAAAKHPWLLLLTAGARPQVGWESAARGHISHFPDYAGRFRLSVAAPGWAARLAELQATWLGRPEQGLLVAKPRYAAGSLRVRRLEARVLVDRLDGATARPGAW